LGEGITSLRRTRAVGAATTRFIWDGQKLILETDGGGTTQAQFTLGQGVYGDLISQRRGSTSRWYHFDALGSTDRLTGADGSATDTYIYKAFGPLAASTGSTTNPFRYVGRLGYYDQGSAYIHTHDGEYRTDLGRYLSLGSTGAAGITGLGLSAYVCSLSDGPKPIPFCDIRPWWWYLMGWPLPGGPSPPGPAAWGATWCDQNQGPRIWLSQPVLRSCAGYCIYLHELIHWSSGYAACCRAYLRCVHSSKSETQAYYCWLAWDHYTKRQDEEGVWEHAALMIEYGCEQSLWEKYDCGRCGLPGHKDPALKACCDDIAFWRSDTLKHLQDYKGKAPTGCTFDLEKGLPKEPRDRWDDPWTICEWDWPVPRFPWCLFVR